MVSNASPAAQPSYLMSCLTSKEDPFAIHPPAFLNIEVLAVNAAKDAIELVAKLRAYHHTAQTKADKKHLSRMSTADEDLSQFDISAEEKDRLVAEVIRYVLFRTQQNSGCPIKRDELTQLVTKNYRQRALPAFIINVAKEKLLNIFGYEMRELQRSRPSTNQGRFSQQSVADAKSYVIISQLPSEVYKKYIEDASTSPLTGFTFVVISIVYLAGGKIQEESLWHHLRRLGLFETDESHPVLGNIRQALEALVQQRYLQKEKANGPEGNTLFYELAERALDGPVNERIKEYISQIVQKDVTPVDVD